MKTLVYTLAFGAEWEKMANTMMTSLREAGGYDGEIRLFKQPWPLNLGEERLGHPWFQKAVIGRDLDLSGYDRVMYVDADCLWVGKVEPFWGYIEPGNPVAAFREFEMVAGAQAFYLAAGAHPLPGYWGFNAGLIVADAQEWQRICTLWLKVSVDIQAWGCDCKDQNSFNVMLKERQRHNALPDAWIYFPYEGRRMSQDVRVIHCTVADKANMQRGFGEMHRMMHMGVI